MADQKISELTNAATPLAGTEVLPIVQSAATVKVTVAALTSGRAVSAASLALTTALPVTSGGTGATTATGTGSVVLATSPSLTTPTLGVASATLIAAGLGAVSTPAYTFTGDLNTGMWSPAADTIAFSEGGAEVMRIDSSSNVGIGTTSPGVKLHVSANGPCIKTDGTNSSAIIADVQITRSSSGTAVQSGPNITFTDGTANNNIAIQNSQGNLAFWNFGSATWLERMRIASTGNVGIGTNAPSVKLHVSNNGAAIKTDGTDSTNISPDVQIARSSSGTVIQSGPNITFADGTDNNTVAIQNSQGNLGFWNYGSATWLERVRIGALGSVGIGTSTLTAKLNVSTDGSAIKTDGASSANIVADVQIARSSSGTAIQSGPNITFTDGTANNTVSIQNSQGNLGFWNFGSATWLERMRIDALGNVSAGVASLATTATNGFLYISACAGIPTGTPTSKTGFAPMVVDSTNNKLYVYIGGAWRVMN
jgi:hypothetical protein